MLKKFVATLALMAMFIVTGCGAPVEEKAPLITADDVPSLSDISESYMETDEEEISDETLGEEGEEVSNETLDELLGEQITAEDGDGGVVLEIPTLSLPEIPTPVIPAVITPGIVEVEEVSDEILPVDVDGIIIPAASAEIILAQCLTANGAKLYTASWCGHCQNQKDAFLDGVEYIDHTECAADDGWAQECKDAGVEAVPTWTFADGTTKSGNTPLADLADRGGCVYE